jgi:hypothetical protein
MAKRERDPGDVTECFSRIVAFFEEKERVAKKLCITNRKEKKVTEKCVTASGVATYFENLRRLAYFLKLEEIRAEEKYRVILKVV